MTTVLFAVTGAPVWTMRDGSTIPSGFWADELLGPFDILTAAGISVVIATPGGAPAPLQEYSFDVSMTGSAEQSATLQAHLASLRDQLDRPLAFADVNPAGFDAVYVPGGSGPMEDLHADADLGRILSSTQSRGATIATTCHGTIALLSARGPRRMDVRGIPDDGLHQRGGAAGRTRRGRALHARVHVEVRRCRLPVEHAMERVRSH